MCYVMKVSLRVNSHMLHTIYAQADYNLVHLFPLYKFSQVALSCLSSMLHLLSVGVNHCLSVSSTQKNHRWGLKMSGKHTLNKLL